MKYFISKHLFYSLAITFVLLTILEMLRNGFVTDWINIGWIFSFLILSGFLSLIFKPE